MKPKINISVIVVIILIIIASVFAWCVSAGIGGKKVTITGTVYYDMISKWGVTFDDSIVEEDSFISLPLWYLPWETKDIEVIVELSNGKQYTTSVWTDKLNLIIGSTNFNIVLHHVPDGDYFGTITVYEVEKGFLWGEKTRVLQATSDFEVII